MSIAASPQLVRAAVEFLADLEVRLRELLHCPVGLTGRVAAAPVVPQGALSRHCVFALLELAQSGSHGILELEAPIVVAALTHLAGGRATAVPVSRLTRVEEAGLGYLVLVALNALREHAPLAALLGPRLVSVHGLRAEVLEQVDQDAGCVSFDVDIVLGPARGAGRLLVPSSPLRRAIEALLPSAWGSMDLPGVGPTLEFRLVGGAVTLCVENLGGLARGDVIIIGEMAWAAGLLAGDVSCRGNGLELRGHVDGGRFTLQRLEEDMHSKDVATDPATTQPVSTLSVEAEVELARVRVPVSQLARWRPGTVVPLRVRVADPVQVRIDGRIVATAELVDIEGEVGARILSTGE